MEPDAPRPRSAAWVAVLAALGLLAAAGLFLLGVWQVQRLGWKETLIARVDARLKEAPSAMPGRPNWPALTLANDEYRRIAVQGRFDTGHEVLVRASTALGAGWWVLTPLRAGSGDWVLVNRGFVAPDMKGRVPPPPETGDSEVTGLLRFTEPGGGFLQDNVPDQGRWYSRDVAAIAAAQGLQGPVAPFFLDAQALTPEQRAAWPRPGLTVIHFANDHLVYALTWFALAAGMAGAVGWLLYDERRLRQRAGTLQRAT